MKNFMKCGATHSTVIISFLISFLLAGFVCFSEAQVTITRQPENTTACIGSNVTISCGYQWSTVLPVTWIINGTSFTQQEVVDSPLYQLNNPTTPMITSLTVFSINHTTTFQCVVQSTPNTNSTLGTVTVIVKITRPPENSTVCGSSRVTISCGYLWSTALPVTWIINGTSFTQHEIENNPSLYRLNNPMTPESLSLTLKSINHNFTIQCIVHSTLNIISTPGTTTVIADVPVVEITATGGCGYVSVSWTVIDNNDICEIADFNVLLVSVPTGITEQISTDKYSYNFTGLSDDTLFRIGIIGSSELINTDPVYTSVITKCTFNLQNCTVTSPSTGTIRVSCDSSYQILVTLTCTNNCNNPMMTSNGSSPLTVRGLDPGMMYSVMINVFNGSQVGDQTVNLSITVMSDNSDTFILQNCTVTSPSIGTIRVSCDSSHQILVTLTCTNNCNNPMVTSNGSSPLTVRGLDPGMMYSITINVFDGNQVVLSDQNVTLSITVMSDNSGSGSNQGGDDDSDNTVAVAVITFTVTFVVSVTATAIITFVVTYHCVKRKFLSVDLSNQPPQEKVLYEQVRPSSHSITKDDLELQPNPAYDTSHKVTMDATPAYECIK